MAVSERQGKEVSVPVSVDSGNLPFWALRTRQDDAVRHLVLWHVSTVTYLLKQPGEGKRGLNRRELSRA